MKGADLSQSIKGGQLYLNLPLQKDFPALILITQAHCPVFKHSTSSEDGDNKVL